MTKDQTIMDGDLLDIASTPIDLPETVRNLQSLMDQLPAITAPELFMQHRAAFEGEAMVAMATRVPAHWAVLIDEIRQRPGTMLPDIFPKRSDLLRWCILVGIAQLYQLAKAVDGGNLAVISPDMQARIFVEKKMAKLVSRADIITVTFKTVERLAASLDSLISIDEHAEAANMFTEWFDEAQQQDDAMWSSFFVKAIVKNKQLQEVLLALYRGGHIIDDYVVELMTEAKILDIKSFDTPTNTDDEDDVIG